MNPLGNITFYDGLCKLCVGILLIGWISFTVRCLGFDSIHDLQQTILIALFVIISFVVGNLWHHLFIEKVFFCSLITKFRLGMHTRQSIVRM